MKIQEIYQETKSILENSFTDFIKIGNLVKQLDKIKEQDSLYRAVRQYVLKVQETMLRVQYDEVYVTNQIDTINTMEMLLDEKLGVKR